MTDHPNQTVHFTEMQYGTAEEYRFLDELEADYARGTADRIMAALAALEGSFSGYQVSRLAHSLQSATRAHRDGRDEEYVVAALLHDIGDGLAPYSHSELAAAILRPYVSEKTYWIIKVHGVFQMYYYAHHLGGDRNARERYRGHVWFDDAAEFCEKYDQNCFDPSYDHEPLSFFQPMVKRLFSRPPAFGERTANP